MKLLVVVFWWDTTQVEAKPSLFFFFNTNKSAEDTRRRLKPKQGVLEPGLAFSADEITQLVHTHAVTSASLFLRLCGVCLCWCCRQYLEARSACCCCCFSGSRIYYLQSGVCFFLVWSLVFETLASRTYFHRLRGRAELEAARGRAEESGARAEGLLKSVSELRRAPLRRLRFVTCCCRRRCSGGCCCCCC